MAAEQGFDFVNAVILFGSASVGALVGAIAQKKLASAKLNVYVTSCELSSSLLSHVDYLEMPDRLSKKFSNFNWKFTLDDEQISSTSNILPIGYAQENYYYLQEFMRKTEEAKDLLEKEIERFKSGDEKSRKESVAKILRDPILIRLLVGKIRRAGFSILKDLKFIDTLEIKDKCTVFPWVIDDASGVGKGTLGAFTIHIDDARVAFPFQWVDERKRMEIVSFLLASLHEKAVPTILKEMLEELNEDRSNANDIYLWFKENIDLNSTFVCNVAITNTGKASALLSGEGLLTVYLPEGGVLEIPCYAQTYTEGTEEDRSVARTIKVLRHISKLLDIAIPIGKRVVTEKVLVPGGAQRNISLKSRFTIDELSEGEPLLNLYKSRKLEAKLVLYQENGTQLKVLESERFAFASSIK